MGVALPVSRIVVAVCDSCGDWFKLKAGPVICPKCGRNDVRVIHMYSKAQALAELAEAEHLKSHK